MLFSVVHSPTKSYKPLASGQPSYSELLRNQLSKTKPKSYNPYPSQVADYKPIRIPNTVIPVNEQVHKDSVNGSIHLFVRIKMYYNQFRSIIKQRAAQVYRTIFTPWIKKTNH